MTDAIHFEGAEMRKYFSFHAFLTSFITLAPNI